MTTTFKWACTRKLSSKVVTAMPATTSMLCPIQRDKMGSRQNHDRQIREAIKITLQGTHRKHKNSFRKTSFTKFVSTKTSCGKTSFTTFDSTKSWEYFFYNIFPPTKFFKKNFFYKSCSNKNTQARTSFTKLFHQ